MVKETSSDNADEASGKPLEVVNVCDYGSEFLWYGIKCYQCKSRQEDDLHVIVFLCGTSANL